MPQPPKPGVDWPELRSKWIKGASQGKLAADYGVSHVAISKRIKREGWVRAPMVTKAQQSAVIHEDFFRELISHKFTPELAAQCLEGARMNMPLKAIAAAVGVSESAMSIYLRNENFRTAMNRARAESAMLNLTNLQNAADRGDVKATLTQLAANPLTAEEFKGAGGTGSTQINVLVNVPRDGQQPSQTAVRITAPVIDHEPAVVTVK